MIHAAEQWAAIHALFEVTRVDVETIALAAGMEAATVKKRAAEEGWRRPESSDDDMDA